MGHLLLDAHIKLRRGEFDDKLRDLVLAHSGAWRTLEKEEDRLKANYVVAEVFDYFGDYSKARECLEEKAAEQADALERETKKGRAGLNRDLFKRRIWLAIAHAMTFYRRDEFEACIGLIEMCHKALDEVDAGANEYFGTRARLAHTRARADRQLHLHDDARRGFNESMVFARKGFVLKTKWAEQSQLDSPPFGKTPELREMFEHQRLLSHWTIGRCLAPGLGYIDYTTGRLSSADTLLSAGYSLLRGTGDVIQRAYAMLLMGAVGRARAGDDPDQLKDAIKLLENGANVLRQHPMLTLRASYELALAYYKDSALRSRATKEINTLKANAKGSPRWMSSALVVESRIERLNGKAATARQRAEKAVEWAKAAGNRHVEILAEALIALGESHASEAEAFDKRKRPDKAQDARRQAVEQFGEALKLSVSNPKMAAVCHLHLASTHIAQGPQALFDAHQSRDGAAPYLRDVEHGFVKKLAEAVDKALDTSGMHVMDVRTGSLNKTKRTSETEAFLIKQAFARTRFHGAAAELLDIGENGLSKAIKRLKQGRYLPTEFGDARRKLPSKRPASLKKR